MAGLAVKYDGPAGCDEVGRRIRRPWVRSESLADAED
jgi:hypothetical protein